MTDKKNIDYSASAVNLVNPPQVEGLLRELQNQSTMASQLRNQAEALIPDELKTKIKKADDESTRLSAEVHKAIDEFGSYQDLLSGSYAIKQMKRTIAYEPKLVRDNLDEKLARMVIIEAVDKTKLAGLVKGGFITQEQSDACGIAQISYAYIIK